MAHDVFISYSLEDKPIADAICAHLEAARIRCWIAPRDLGRNRDARKATERAIAHCRVLVLVFSAHANASDEITQELYLGAKANAVLIPVKIDDTVPVLEKQYYLGRPQWHATQNPPTAEQLRLLVERVRAVRAVSIGKPKRTGLAWFYLIPSVLILLGLLAGLVSMVASAQVGLLRLPTPIPVAVAASATSTPTAIVLPTATPIPTATPWPTSRATPPAMVIPGQAVYKESFDNPQYNGSLPPLLQQCPNALATQHDGILEVVHNTDKSSCTIDLGITLKLGQFKTLDSKLSYSYGAGIGFYLINDMTKERLDFSCGRPTATTFCLVGKPDAALPDFVTPGKASFDKWSYVRIELVDANTLEWAFYIDNTRLSSYPMTVEQASHWRGSTLEFYIITYPFDSSPFDSSGNVLRFDDISIIAR
jgi:TIR domain